MFSTLLTLSSAVCFLSVLERIVSIVPILQKEWGRWTHRLPTLIEDWILTTPRRCTTAWAFPTAAITSSQEPSIEQVLVIVPVCRGKVRAYSWEDMAKWRTDCGTSRVKSILQSARLENLLDLCDILCNRDTSRSKLFNVNISPSEHTDLYGHERGIDSQEEDRSRRSTTLAWKCFRSPWWSV